MKRNWEELKEKNFYKRKKNYVCKLCAYETKNISTKYHKLHSKFISRKVAEHLSLWNEENINLKKGLFIGLAQACAIIPGISRSGMTISAALISGVSNKEAAKFSFLLAIPAI